MTNYSTYALVNPNRAMPEDILGFVREGPRVLDEDPESLTYDMYVDTFVKIDKP